MEILFISSVSVITAHVADTRKLLVETLGLPLKQHEGSDYYLSESIEGCKHFGAWPLLEAAKACFGADEWPRDRPVPQVSIEFEVASPDAVASGAQELEAKGYAVLHETRTEPWGQTVCRVLTPDGAILGISYAPWMHRCQLPTV
jgi:catechol 2,3-dioxygenase-like lactoylglutathione lyase family enzyme